MILHYYWVFKYDFISKTNLIIIEKNYFWNSKDQSILPWLNVSACLNVFACHQVVLMIMMHVSMFPAWVGSKLMKSRHCWCCHLLSELESFCFPCTHFLSHKKSQKVVRLLPLCTCGCTWASKMSSVQSPQIIHPPSEFFTVI